MTTENASSFASSRPIFEFARFEKLCMMLGSPADGERAAAALKATQMLKGAGLTWADVIGQSEAFQALARPKIVAGEPFWHRSTPKPRSRSGGTTKQEPNDVLRNQREDQLRPLGPEANPRFRTWSGLIAFDVVITIFNAHPPLGPWEETFMSNLESKALAERPNNFGITVPQWKSLIAIATRLGFVRATSLVPERYALVEGED